VFLTGTIDSYLRLISQARAPQSLLIGPWPHIPWQSWMNGVDFGPSAGTSVDEVQRRFFDRWLKGRDQDRAGGPFARVFTMGENRWREAGSWSDAPTGSTLLHLSSGGRANSRAGDGCLGRDEVRRKLPPDLMVCDPGYPVVDVGGRSCCYPEVTPMGPADQREVEHRMDVLVFETEPLVEDVLVIGTPRLVTYVLIDQPSADLVARVCDVHPDGRSINVSDGNVRFSGTGIQEITLSLSPTAVRFGIGHRIRLDLAGSSFPTLDRNPHTGGVASAARAEEFRVASIAVFHDERHPSRLELPLDAGLSAEPAVLPGS
jgi:putative CocE/NonD family hydrolase